MAISPQSIHKPLNDFFLSKFSTSAGSPVFFRFDKFGSVVSDEDFVDPMHPERGYVPAIATEKFSDLVNRIPIDQGDGTNILLSSASIDELYFYHLLNPSVPYLKGVKDQVKESVMNAFNAIKANAVKVWNNVKLESTQGMSQFRPASATPINWYDRTKNDVWTSYSIKVSETTPTPGPPPPIFRMKLSDEAMKKLLNVEGTHSAAIGNISARILSMQQVAQSQNSVAVAAERGVATLAPQAMMLSPIAIARPVADLQPATVPNPVLHDQLINESRALNISSRVLVNQYIGISAPKQPLNTNSISISFDYCKTDIKRTWYIDTFVNDKSWFLPGVPKGQLTSNSTVGMSLLPIGFVAIRNLVIEANWSAEDAANAAVSDGFGPFKVSFDSATKRLVHPGMQIGGWVLQKFQGDLPPNNPD
jgi:hypothetical protein